MARGGVSLTFPGPQALLAPPLLGASLPQLPGLLGLCSGPILCSLNSLPQTSTIGTALKHLLLQGGFGD